MVLASKQTKTPSIHHRKRHGQHHKVTKTYHQTYFPYLPLVIIIGLGVLVNSLWAHTQRGVLGYSTDMSVTNLLADTNAQRIASHESALRLNTQLDAAAQAKANNMVELNYWSHYPPNGQSPSTFATKAGYDYAAMGENLAYGFTTSQDVIAAWMSSPDHRANMLNGAYQDVGFGIASSPNYRSSGPETIVVAEYGKPISTTSTIASLVPTSNSTPTATSTLNATPVSRLQLISSNTAPFGTFAVSALATLCFVALFIRHGLIWRRVLRKGEAFALKYHLLDVVLVGVGVIGFLLTRNSGFIH